MTITGRLMQLDPTLTIQDEPTEHGYHCFNLGGVECEVGEFLYGLVRLTQPKNVLETGTHHGIAASYIATALKDNGSGLLDTIEFIMDNFYIALKRFVVLEVTDYVMVNAMPVDKFSPKTSYQLMLLDTEPDIRFDELLRFYSLLDEGGYIFIHDLAGNMSQEPNSEHGFGWPFGEVPEEIKQLVKEDRLRPFHFRNPRGLTGFYKPRKEDYKWI